MTNLVISFYGWDVSRASIPEAAISELAQVGFDPVYGARPLKRAIQQQVENPLAREILAGRFAPKDTIRVDARRGEFVFERLMAPELAE